MNPSCALLQADDVDPGEAELCELLAQLDGAVYRINNEPRASPLSDPPDRTLVKP